MIDDKTLDSLYKVVKGIPWNDRMACLSFLMTNRLFGSDDEQMKSVIYQSLYNPADNLGEFGSKWKKRLKKEIDEKGKKTIKKNLQYFCDHIVMIRSIRKAFQDLESCCDEKIETRINSNYVEFKLIFRSEISQTLVLAEVANNLQNDAETWNKFIDFGGEIKKFDLTTKFNDDNSLAVDLKVAGKSLKGFKATYSNSYRLAFNAEGNDVIVTQKDRYDSIGRRIKCQG